MDVRGKNIYVGLSGGVDSSVTAYLLQQAGAVVTGVFIQGWYPPGMPCTWATDRRDAMRVAANLHIPFETLDASAEYKKGVIDYLLAEYKAGRTPNPDVMCNREVKFGAFYNYAMSRGADFVATGHYAQMIDGELHRGVSGDKDQSYFLWAVPEGALAHTLFPLGGMEKDAVRAVAKRAGIPVAEKKDSQGICFLGSISVEDFLIEEFGTSPGEARKADGEKVGTHNGALLHTLGARIALTDAEPGPWYVVGKDIPENVLIVSKERVAHESGSTVELLETNWLGDAPSGTYEAQYRYHGPIVTGVKEGNKFTLEKVPEPIAEGQSLVLYQGERVCGGGIIGRTCSS